MFPVMPTSRAATFGQFALTLLITLSLFPPQTTAQTPAAGENREKVHADISTRSVRVTSSFTGTEIIVFGSIENGRPERPEEGDVYDVVVVLEGTAQKLVVRKKGFVAGIWINRQAITFESVPSYYAISSTRPVDEIANDAVLRKNDIGFDRVRMTPASGWDKEFGKAELQEFKKAVIRIKQKNRLYVQKDYDDGVLFVGGASLFRTTIDLPANVPVGVLRARVHLFRNGKMLSVFQSQVKMHREGVERFLHGFAFGYPFLYGIAAVLIAAGAGLAASSYFNRARG